MSGAWRVEVRRNMVVAIRHVADGTPIADPLAISTLLAQNNLAHGCLDGDYDLDSFEAARHFAGLCIGFLKNLCERSLDAIPDVGKDGEIEWINPFVPGSRS